MIKRLLFIALLATPGLLYAQTRTISGVVKDSGDGSGIPGVNVVVDGTSRGVATDAAGNFKVQLEGSEDVLVFSFIGYKTQRVAVGSRAEIQVSMESEATQLAEIVVVGYGEMKKSDVTGAVANIKGEELTRQPVLTASQALQGKVAGVQIISSGQPGSSPQIRLRGVGTAFSGTTTLYVVDGVLTDDISNINTSDIVDMNILKDASAAAIYGSRGANGVIIITTRKGVAGKLKVNYNNNIGFRQAANLVKMANSAEYSNYVQAATGTAPSGTGNTDWYGTILRNAFEQNHNISLSGGSDKITHLFNIGYLNDQGIVLENQFKRLTLRLNEEYKITDNLKFGFQSSFGNSINENRFGSLDIDAYGNIGSVYNDAYRAAPIIPGYVNGKYGNTSAFQNVGNPLLDLNSNSARAAENRLQGSAYVELKPIKSLTLRSSIGADSRSLHNRLYNYQFNNDESTFLIAGGNQFSSNSGLNVKNTESFRWVWDNTVTFNKTINDHSITALVGTTAEKFHLDEFSAYRKNVPADPALWYIGVGDANTSQNGGGGDEWSRNSYLARVNYSYKERYLLTATVRSDGSSRLPVKNRWQQYPSLGLGWIVSRESFMQKQNVFDLLKLRFSYGVVGNDQIPTDAYFKRVTLNKPYPYSGSAGAATNGSAIQVIVDPNITWEKTKEFNLGVEFGLIKSKLTGEVNYYNKKVENALINIPIPKTVGDIDALVVTNATTIQNKGLEVALNWRDEINKDLSYSISANATFNKNTILALNGGQAIYGGSIGAGQGYTTYTDNGQPIGSFYVLKVLGVFNTTNEVNNYMNGEGKVIQPNAKPGDFKYLDKNGDGQIDDSDRTFAGSYQPVAYFGTNFEVTYKQWDFNMSIYGNVGNHVYNGKKAVRISGTDNVEKSIVYNRWTSGNQSQTEPAANTGNLPASDYFVESGSFVRINNLTIGYKFPAAAIERFKISNLRAFVMSQNLFTLKKYSGFTAELPGDPLSSGIELTSYPTTRTIAIGINVGF